MDEDLIYFRERSRIARSAALRAPHPVARAAHLAMAAAYDERVRLLNLTRLRRLLGVDPLLCQAEFFGNARQAAGTSRAQVALL